jgi:putative hydrolase of the HAD superfamily
VSRRASGLAWIFDLDDTLYCEHDYVRSGFRAVAAHLAERHRIPAAELYKEMVRVWQEDGRGRVFDRVCAKFRLNDPVADLVEVYRGHEPDISLYEDARQLMDAARERGVKLGLITDGDARAQRRKIRALGIEKWISAVVVSDELGGPECWKPHPLPYEMAARQLGVPLHECVYVGDNPHKDFVTARKLGMGTIRIIRPQGDHMGTRLGPEHEADEAIESLTTLINRM